MHKVINTLARELRALRREHEELGDRIDDLKVKLEDVATAEPKNEDDEQDEDDRPVKKKKPAVAPTKAKRDFFDEL